MSPLSGRDHATFTLAASGVQLWGNPTVSHRSQEKALTTAQCQKAVSQPKSDVSSPPEDCRAAAFWQFALRRQLRMGGFCPYFCWVGLWETRARTVLSRSGSLPMPRDCKMSCKVLYTLTQALTARRCIFCICFYQTKYVSPTPTPTETISDSLCSFVANLWRCFFLPVLQEI